MRFYKFTNIFLNLLKFFNELLFFSIKFIYSIFAVILALLVASSLAESEPDLGHHRFEPVHHQVDVLESSGGSGEFQEAQVEIEALSDPDAVNPLV